MEQFIEKLIGRLEEEQEAYSDTTYYAYGVGSAIKIVNQLAEEHNKREFYEITLNGCDDDTTFVMEMTELEHEFLIRVSQKANETSTYGCMPRLYVEKAEMIEPKGE